ncbi:unnamed protein product [Merluccius merluccius]
MRHGSHWGSIQQRESWSRERSRTTPHQTPAKKQLSFGHTSPPDCPPEEHLPPPTASSSETHVCQLHPSVRTVRIPISIASF